MKTFSLFVKYVVVPCSTVVGLFFGFDAYILDRAHTVVRPVEVKVESITNNVEEIKIRTRNIESILMHRKIKSQGGKDE